VAGCAGIAWNMKTPSLNVIIVVAVHVLAVNASTVDTNVRIAYVLPMKRRESGTRVSMYVSFRILVALE
jgi:hypothetical protein